MTTDLATITLAKGSHPAPPDDCDNPERCLFEAYNWIVRQRHTDGRPPGVSPVLHTFGMRLNDILPDDRRQELKRFLPNGADRLAGTESDGKDETRGYIAFDWLIRTCTPMWLDLAGLSAEAAALRDLRRIADLVAAQSAGPVARDASSKAAAALDAAGAAAGDAAGAAPWVAAWAAAGAARDAARAAAGDAAAAAAGDAAGAAARAAAWAAARDAAWAAAGAARDAARAAAGDASLAAARDAARAAARDKLAPTVAELQASAIALYDVLITGEWPPS